MNTESRGQSNQNEQKDKACQMLVNIADQQTLRPTKRQMFLWFSENVNLPAIQLFHAANVARGLRV
jgi:hypothetical protein